MCSNIYAHDPDYDMRVSWTKTLKQFLVELEKKDAHLLVDRERHFLERFHLFEEAWADTRYNCFYGGWPSVKVGKHCQNPAKVNSSYNQKSCKSSELQCQPLLFGKGLCVSGESQEEKNKIFSGCEKKFSGSYDFLKNLTREEAEDFRELSTLAGDICRDEPDPSCMKIQAKLKDGIKSIDRAFVRAIASTPMSPVSVPAQSVPPTLSLPDSPHKEEECEDPEHAHPSLSKSMNEISSFAGKGLYDKIKVEFQSSPMCDPLKVLNNPAERPSAVVIARLVIELKDVDYIGNKRGSKDEYLNKLADKWQLSAETKREVLPILNKLMPYPQADDERKNLVARAKGLIIQDVMKNYRPDETMRAEVKEELVKNRIFTSGQNGEIECPFVSKDAFMKALQGRENALKAQGSVIKKKGQITIVDYTRPSNERRLFVIDLDSQRVLHNTWVAHGRGDGSQSSGADGFGSSPEMSNMSGSNMSSDGFVLASKASSGQKYGPNVILKGIDQNNSNMQARAVVLHGWDSPMNDYSDGIEDYNFKTERYDPPYDVIARAKETDFRNSSTQEMEKALWGLRSSTMIGQYLAPTEGCLGVPKTNAGHLDRRGRNKSQLELLREDLPGSLIFNYSGPQMKSKFLK
jgi:hypothetical protein